MRRFLIFGAFIALVSGHAATLSTGTAAPWLVNGNPVVELTSVPSDWWVWRGPSPPIWVGTTATDGNPGIAPGTYVFTIAIGAWAWKPDEIHSFSIFYSASLSVVWLIDGGGQVDYFSRACGINCATSVNHVFGSFGPESVLTAWVTNRPGGGVSPPLVPMGLIASGATGVIPEPSTYAMVALACVVMVFASIRRK
jgi:hypothetical protein